MWTFETRYGGDPEWAKSAQRFHKREDAIAAALKWVGVMLENGEAVEVRLCHLQPL